MLDVLLVLRNDASETCLHPPTPTTRFLSSFFSIFKKSTTTTVESHHHSLSVSSSLPYFILSPSFFHLSPMHHFLQRFGSAKIVYRTLVDLCNTVTGEQISSKYGILQEQDLLDDLLNWTALHAAGRLHKQVLLLTKEEGDVPAEVLTALSVNRLQALRTALLLLPNQFTLGTLLRTIVGLSYQETSIETTFLARVQPPIQETFGWAWRKTLTKCSDWWIASA